MGSAANPSLTDATRMKALGDVAPNIVTAPVELIASMTLLFYLLGWGALAGLGVMLSMFPVQFYVSKKMMKVQT